MWRVVLCVSSRVELRGALWTCVLYCVVSGCGVMFRAVPRCVACCVGALLRCAVLCYDGGVLRHGVGCVAGFAMCVWL